MDLTLTIFTGRKSPKGTRQSLTWEALVRRLQEPIRTNETLDEYARLSNEQRTDIKDVGGYVGGVFEGDQRSKNKLLSRSLLVIDADHATGDDVEDYELLYDTVFLCHSTHSSTKREPRLRWIFPLSRPVTAEEYRVLADVAAGWVGRKTIDETTDQPERLMFWPSVAKDAEYYVATGGSVILNPDDYLDEDFEPAPEPAPQIESPVSDSNEVMVIGEGQRNKTVFGFASMLRGNGLDQSGIRSMVDDYNDRYCDPPLPPEELDTIVRSVCSHFKPGDPVHPALRDAWDDFNDLGTWKESEPKQIKRLKEESLTSLWERDVPAPVYAVEGLITTGITILASPPKFGKSWMCMDLAMSVANGSEFLGMKTHKQSVIYLALEDGDFRLKERSMKSANGNGSAGVYLVKEAPIIKDGLLGMIVDLLDSHEDHVGMIIIDTLQKIRGVAGKTEGVYGYDYRELGQLHQFALDKNLSLVLVHHLNKAGDDTDFVSRLNGSTGVSGAADTIITLTKMKRGDNMTKMSITGRDVVERTLVLQMDWPNYRWICLGEEQDVEKEADEHAFWNDPVTKTIIHFLDEAQDTLEGPDVDQVEWRCSSSQLLKSVEQMYGQQKDLSAVAIGLKIKKLQPMLGSLAGITYEYQRGTSKREHVFIREVI